MTINYGGLMAISVDFDLPFILCQIWTLIRFLYFLEGSRSLLGICTYILLLNYSQRGRS